VGRYAPSPARFWWLLALSGALVTGLFYLFQDPRIAGPLSALLLLSMYGLLVLAIDRSDKEDNPGSRWGRAARRWLHQRRRKRLRRATPPDSDAPPERGDPPSSGR